ncbi:MAG: hypothetical protein AAB638_00055 [Patescibacteria group bacterium]
MIAIVAVAVTLSTAACGGGGNSATAGTPDVSAEANANADRDKPCGSSSANTKVTVTNGWWSSPQVSVVSNANAASPCHPCPSKCESTPAPPAPAPKPAPAKKPVVAKPVVPSCECPPKPPSTETTARAERRRDEFVLDMPDGLDKPGLLLQAEAQPVVLAQTAESESPAQPKQNGCRGRRCR